MTEEQTTPAEQAANVMGGMGAWIESKRTFGLMLEVLGLVAIAFAFKIQADNNASNAVGSILGAANQGTTAPYLVGGAGLLAIVLGVLMVRGEARESRTEAGWHDDPESPTRLRYHDGQRWTEKTAEKA